MAITVRLKVGVWSQDERYEYPLLLAMLGDVLVWSGPGRFSLDQAAGLTSGRNIWVSVAATAIGFGVAVLMRAVLHQAPRNLAESKLAA